MRNTNQQALQTAEDAFRDFDPFETYRIVFELMDDKKLTLSKIKDIAANVGISPQIVQHRRDVWIYENSGVTTYLDTFCK